MGTPTFLVFGQPSLAGNKELRDAMLRTGCLDLNAPYKGYAWVGAGGQFWTVLVPTPGWTALEVEGILCAEMMSRGLL
jgi:hypothetical protein